MKKLFITAAALLASLAMSAQLFTAGTPVALQGVTGEEVALSADGSFVVVATNSGIEKVDVTTGEKTLVAKGSGLYNLNVTADNNRVVYVRPQYNKRLRYISLESVDMTDNSTKVLVKPSRKLNGGIAVNGSTVNAVNNGKRQSKSLDGTKAVNAPVASISYGHLQLTDANGKTVTLDPLGRGSYIWPSVSPDGTRVAFWLVGSGCYTCAIDGSDVKWAGRLGSAVWADNNVIVGMVETNGQAQQPDASALVAVDINNGTSQTLTDNSVIAMYPRISADGSRIAFVEPGGQVYVMDLSK